MSMLRSALPVPLKHLAWNLKYLMGYTFDEAPNEVVQYIRQHVSPDGSVLELGCGHGSLLTALGDDWSGQYHGVDISESAIARARATHTPDARWSASSIEGFRSEARWDVIVMIESIYYVNLDQAREVLVRLRGYLSENGFVLIRIHDVTEHAAYVSLLNALNFVQVRPQVFVFQNVSA